MAGAETGLEACHILHVDMDAFYASIEVRDTPQWRGMPLIVGGGPRGVVLSATYDARRFGVRSAMPIAAARRLCPHALIVPARHECYVAASRQIRQIFDSITPVVEPLSLDEAFLDVGGSQRLFGSPLQIAERIRSQVVAQVGVTCSVGVAGRKYVAKLASDAAKPDGCVVVPPEHVLQFVHKLPVEALWGVGNKTMPRLAKLGIRTVKDLATTPLPALRHALGNAIAEQLYAMAWGYDPRSVEADTTLSPARSISHDHTFDVDVAQPPQIRRELLRLSGKVARRLRCQQRVARRVTIVIRHADFTTVTRSHSLGRATESTAEVFAAARSLYEGLGIERARIRLVGVRVDQLHPKAEFGVQHMLGEPEHTWADVDQVMDQLREKFGREAVIPATLIDYPPLHQQKGSSW